MGYPHIENKRILSQTIVEYLVHCKRTYPDCLINAQAKGIQVGYDFSLLNYGGAAVS